MCPNGMRLPRFLGLLDLAVIVFVAIVLLLPGRERSAVPGPDDPELRYALALAEARVDAHPTDGAAVEDLGRLLAQASFKDWAIDATVHAAKTAPDSPTKWRALLAASVAYVDRVDATQALDYAHKALEACDRSGEACPSWERLRLDIYRGYLDRGVSSGIDPHRDPIGFKRAAEGGIHQIRVKSTPSGQAPRQSPRVPRGML